MNSLPAATTAAALVAGVTLASAQSPGGTGGGDRGDGRHMHQGAAGGGSGGGHAPSTAMQGRSSGHAGGYHQAHGPSSASGALHAQRGHALHEQRGHMLTGQRGHRGHAVAAQRAHRGHAVAGQRAHRGHAVAEHRRMHAQHVRTTSRTGTRTAVAHDRRGTHAFAQAGTRSRISLSSQQRTRIHNVVLHRGFISRFRVTDVNFDVRVGVRVPRSFHLFVVPEDIVIIAPQFRGYRCFVFDDELVIVDAFTFEIIAIIPV